MYKRQGKACPLYYVEHEDAWQSFKDDVKKAMDQLDADETDSETTKSEDNGTVSASTAAE